MQNPNGSFLRLERTRVLQQTLQLAGVVEALDVRVAANVLLPDVDVGNGALAGDVLEGILQVGAVGCKASLLVFSCLQEDGGATTYGSGRAREP